MKDRSQDAKALRGEEVPDETLMRRFCQTLDEEVFRKLAVRYYEKAQRIAKERLGSEDSAQDAVQEALIRVVRFRRRYDLNKPFGPWFYAVLRNVCTDLQRKELRYQEALRTLAEELPAPDASDSALAQVHDLTAGLSAGEIEILRLRFVDGLTFDELGWHLRCSLEAAKKRVQRLLQRLKP